jgi:hypothetical protein
MENNSEELILDIFSRILIENKLPNLEQLGSLDYEVNSNKGIGPLIKKDNTYAFDLRPISDKGSLSYLHPIYIKSQLQTVNEFHGPIAFFVLDTNNFQFLDKLSKSFKYVEIKSNIHGDFHEYTLKDLSQKNKISNKSISLTNFLFSSKSELINLSVFDLIDCETAIIDLGIGASLFLSNEKVKPSPINSSIANIINPFFTYIQNILLNNGNGRIKEINEFINIENSFGLNFAIPDLKRLDEKAVIYNADQSYINIPASITDELLNYLKRDIYGK